MAKGECEHPYYKFIGKGKKQCVKCGETVTYRTQPVPQEDHNVGTN